MKSDVLVRLLEEMAVIVDGPEGPGGGAILLSAACEIEDQIRKIRALEADRIAKPESTTP